MTSFLIGFIVGMVAGMGGVFLVALISVSRDEAARRGPRFNAVRYQRWQDQQDALDSIPWRKL